MFWVYLWGCLWMRLIFEWADRVKQIILNVDGHHPFNWRSEQNKNVKRELLLSDSWCWDIGLFWPSQLDWKVSSSWVLSLTTFRLEFIPLAFLSHQLPNSISWNFSDFGDPLNQNLRGRTQQSVLMSLPCNSVACWWCLHVDVCMLS